MVRRAPIAALLSVAALLGCASEEIPRTQLMLVADTDIAALNQIEFEVHQDERRLTSEKIAVDSADAPFTMAVLREEGALGPLRVRAVGYENDDALVERSAVVWFSPGKTLTVVLHLTQRCMHEQCAEGQTCTERGCESADPGVLAPWNGRPPMLDGEGMDAGQPHPDAGQPAPDADSPDGGAPQEAGEDASDAGASETDASDAALADCGAMVDLNSDVNHCGGCGQVCRGTMGSGNNLVPACIDGECGNACRSLWGDCDGDTRNGCENWLSYDVVNCGACGFRCASGEYCWQGVCYARQN